MRKRSMGVEPSFGEAKEFHPLRRFRLRRWLKVNIEGVMVAAGQNLKRLIKQRHAVLFCLLLERPHARLSFQPYQVFFNSLIAFEINHRAGQHCPAL